MICSHCGQQIKKKLMEPHVRGHEFQLVKNTRTGFFHYRRVRDRRRLATVDEKVEMINYVRRMGFLPYADPGVTINVPLIDRRVLHEAAA